VAVQAAVDGDLGGRVGAGFDVAAVDPDGGGAREPDPFGGCLVGDQGGPDVGLDAELVSDPRDQARAAG